jgi:hypothetical protein
MVVVFVPSAGRIWTKSSTFSFFYQISLTLEFPSMKSMKQRKSIQYLCLLPHFGTAIPSKSRYISYPNFTDCLLLGPHAPHHFILLSLCIFLVSQIVNVFLLLLHFLLPLAGFLLAALFCPAFQAAQCSISQTSLHLDIGLPARASPRRIRQNPQYH